MCPFNGNDFFRYTIADNLGQPSEQATVTIQPNLTPFTRADAGGGVATDTINIAVLDNDTAIRGQLLASTLTIASGPANGQAIPQADGTITYIPNANFFGTDTFRYTISDTLGRTSVPTKVTVGVTESGLQNPIMSADVNGNGDVTSLDALLVINRLARGGSQGNIPVAPDERGPSFYDVDGSLSITALDALLVINFMGQNSTSAAAELISEPIVIDIATGILTERPSESVDTAIGSVAPASGEGKLIDRTAGSDLVDSNVVDLLAEEQETDSRESESSDSTLNDLAILDLL